MHLFAWLAIISILNAKKPSKYLRGILVIGSYSCGSRQSFTSLMIILSDKDS